MLQAIAEVPVSAGRVDDDTWHHAVLSGAGSSQTLYLDGQPVKTVIGIINNLDRSTPWSAAAGRAGCSPPARQRRVALRRFDRRGGPFRPGLAARRSRSCRRAAPARCSPGPTRPSGNTSAKVSYDKATARVTKVTDANGGVWKISKPAVSGSGQVYVGSVLAAGPADY